MLFNWKTINFMIFSFEFQDDHCCVPFSQLIATWKNTGKKCVLNIFQKLEIIEREKKKTGANTQLT